jgi:hypothetical protein
MEINLNNLYDQIYKEAEAKQKAEEEAEQKELEERIKHFISDIEAKIAVGDLTIQPSEQKALALLIKSEKPDTKFMYLVDAHIEERIVETLEEHGIGPVQCVELESYGCDEDTIEVTLYLWPDKQ